MGKDVEAFVYLNVAAAIAVVVDAGSTPTVCMGVGRSRQELVGCRSELFLLARSGDGARIRGRSLRRLMGGTNSYTRNG